MGNWECTVCGWVYDPGQGDPSPEDYARNGVRGSTGFLGLPGVRRP